VSVRSRALVWDACLNVRDLGGHATEDGGSTRFGVVVRGDSVGRLTAEGWDALVDYGVRTIVDLRLPEERTIPMPDGLPVTCVNVPLLPNYGHPDWDDLHRVTLGVELPDSTRLLYLEFLRRYQAAFGRALTAIADAEDAVLVHCHAGKDRTGLVVALLLRLAGVPPAAVAADYAQSAENLRPLHAAWIESSPTDDDRALRTRLSASPAEAMLGVLAELEERHGGAEGYLAEAGVPAVAIARLRGRLRSSVR
jgi:protein tyrosine/serine phosphatase